MPPTSYRPIIDVVLTDTPGSRAYARADYVRVARRLEALLERINQAGDQATAEELAPLEALAWELARSLSFAVGRISGVESARAFVLASVDQGQPEPTADQGHADPGRHPELGEPGRREAAADQGRHRSAAEPLADAAEPLPDAA